MTNTFRYKNVSLSVFLNAQLGQTANNWLLRRISQLLSPEPPHGRLLDTGEPYQQVPEELTGYFCKPDERRFLRKDRLPPCAGCHAGLPCSSTLVKEDFPEPPRSIYETSRTWQPGQAGPASTRNLSATNSPLRRYVHSHSV